MLPSTVNTAELAASSHVIAYRYEAAKIRNNGGNYIDRGRSQANRQP